ncbi:unnamed protein product, partial [Vitis vinifera]
MLQLQTSPTSTKCLSHCHLSVNPEPSLGAPETFVSRFAADQLRKGSDILVEALESEGVTHVFGYPGGAYMEIHEALARSSMIRNVLPRHEQGGIFAEDGYARASGRPGVYLTSPGLGATNIISGIADTNFDSIPIVAITGQVPRGLMGTDAFQEVPLIDITRPITKFNYLVLDVEDIPRIVKEAFLLATSGQPGTKFNDKVSAWIEEIDEQKEKHPPSYRTFGEAIPPQYAIQLLDELTNGNAIICTGVGQHQMWAAQYYKHKNPRHWLSSSGLGAMGFGLPAAMGAALAKPDAIVVDIDGDGSFMMNIQELATIRVENLPVKIMQLNNQHRGMVYQFQYEYRDVFPDMLMFAEACNITAARVTKKAELREAIEKMLKTPGPYLLDVTVTHQAQVLQLIPDGGTFKDAIKGAQ